MKTRLLCMAVSAALSIGTATLSSATPEMVEGVKNATENAVDSTVDKLPPKRAMSRAEYSAEKKRIQADYKSSHEACKPLAGNSREVCRVEARSDEKVKLADLEARYKATPSAQAAARVARAKAQYEVAKQKCEDQPASDKGACRSNARADESRAVARASIRQASTN